MSAQLIDLNLRGDERGALVAVEDFQIGFDIKRAYFIFGTQAGVARGFHAHHALRQLAIVVRGRCVFHLDDGRRRDAVTLDDPSKGLLIEPMIWHEMSDFSPDSVLLVLADGNYDETDYIRDYSEFSRLVRG